jgi:hypothetical protein
MKERIRSLFVIVLIGCSQPSNEKSASPAMDKLFNIKFEQAMISSGDNFPDFDCRKDHADLLLVSLHKNIPVEDFMKKTNFDENKIKEMLIFLESKNWIHKSGRSYKPTVFIADEKDGEDLYKSAQPISTDIILEIKKELPGIKRSFSETRIAKTDHFDKWSFFILSDVLLDSWQINNVENKFLQKENRPLRHGRHYYVSLFEAGNRKEPFGIYGNQYSTCNGKASCIYGNNRNHANMNSTVNKVSQPDNRIFENIAKSFFPNLLNILEKNRIYADSIYRRSGYSEEISFEEFYIWWYHFIYTQATEQMKAEGLMSIPETGNFEYELE